MPGDLIGRERELRAATEFVAAVEHGSRVLVFAGKPDIGKTTVWQDAVGRARACSILVLTARPCEAEAGLAYAHLFRVNRNISRQTPLRPSQLTGPHDPGRCLAAIMAVPGRGCPPTPAPHNVRPCLDAVVQRWSSRPWDGS